MKILATKLNNLLIPEFIIPLSVTLLVLLIIVLIYLLAGKNKPHYTVKESLMSRTEYNYYRVFESYFGQQYIILPQINLASVIEKQGQGYRSELFRNVDFGVFDYNYKPILLIEINDNTHFRKDRQERDKKVAAILKKAGLKLVTFWTKDGIDNERIFKTLSRYL